ncbi:hypothetical protein SPHINGOR109_30355 [Sphingorhabdus sp. 109]|nr:hypothetical protein SPHINGOR109_30355 [Sphingorhabdus sp. 109]
MVVQNTMELIEKLGGLNGNRAVNSDLI